MYKIRRCYFAGLREGEERRKMKKALALSTIALIIVSMFSLPILQVKAETTQKTINFDDLTDKQFVGTHYVGLTFSPEWRVADMRTGEYNTAGYPPHSWPMQVWTGTYGQPAPWGNSGKITFDFPVSQVGGWFCADTGTVYVEAYDSSGTLITSGTVGPNYGSNTYLSVSDASGRIKYVVIHDESNYWSMDDFTYTPALRKFNPLIDGFQFSNDAFTEKIIMSLEEIREEFESSPLSHEIPSSYWVLFELLIRGLISAQKGYCGGMVFTAKEYFEHPDRLPPGYLCTHDIPITDTTMTEKLIYNQWITQAFGDQYFLKWLLLRLGDAPSGLMPMNNEVEWILQQIDQQKVVELTVFDPSWSSGLDWFMSHVVLAYDYKMTGNSIYLYVYGPNLGGTQTIWLTKDTGGNYKIANGVAYLETFAINRLGSREAPLWGQTWGNVLNYLDELLSHVIEYVMQKATEYTEIFVKWLTHNLKDLWDTLMKIKDRFPDLWNRFVNWVKDNAKDVWNRLVHMIIHSPVNIHVYDPEGAHVGLTSTGDLDLGFDALYLLSDESQYCAIPNPEAGNYIIELVGTGQGSYSLDIALTLGGMTINEQTLSGNIVEGAVYVYTVNIAEEVMTLKPDPATELGHLKTFINTLPSKCFYQPKLANYLKNALSCKIDEVILKIKAGNYTDAINKLAHDIRAKMDGDPTAQDWIIDPTAQFKLCIIVDHIISNIQTLQEKTG